MSWYGQLDETLSADLTQGIQGIVGEDCDFYENVLVETDRCFGWERERDKPCAANQWKRIWKGRRRAKRVNRLCKTNSVAQNLTMTGTQLVQVYGHTAQGASTAQVNAMCKNLKMGTVMGKTQACAISTVAWFFGVNRVPQIATRVEQISEWITMWRGFNVDSRRRIRKVWEKKAPTLAKDHRGWNHATGPISATICSVLEARWKPSTPGFWQAPEACATLDGVLSKRRRVSASGELKMDRALHVGQESRSREAKS